MATREKKPKWLRGLRLLLWLGVQLVVIALLLEGALRIARPFHAGLNTLLYIPTVRTDFSHIEKTEDLLGLTTFGFSPGKETAGFVLNSRGFRTPEYSTSRDGGLRVVALGDSFTYAAVPHIQSWPAQLEEGLRGALPQQEEIEVISLGVPGVGPQFYLRMWELEGQRLRPDLVVLGFFVGNDLVEEGGLGLHSEHHDLLIRHSMVARAIRNTRRLIGSDFSQTAEPADTTASTQGDGAAEFGVEIEQWQRSFNPTRPTFNEETFRRIEGERVAICLKENRELLEQRLGMVQPVLAELDRAVRSAAAELVVLLIPDEFQIDDELAAGLLEDMNLSLDDFDRSLPQRELIRFFEREGIRYVDGLSEFRSQGATERLYLVRDTHWNAAGNRLGAEMVATFLEESALIPAR